MWLRAIVSSEDPREEEVPIVYRYASEEESDEKLVAKTEKIDASFSGQRAG